MLNIRLICVGKLGQRFLSDGCAEYEKRIAPFAKLTIVELAETKQRDEGEAGEKRVIEDESARILTKLDKPREQVVAMCVEGEQLSSPQLAQLLENAARESGAISFIIGGSLGLSDELKSRADKRLSVSKMTLPHQLARLVLLEQLYRACTINNHVKYHK